MNAVVFTAPHTFVLESRPEGEPAEGTVRFEPAFVGICGTDLHIAHGRHRRARPPLVLGHEVAGTIASGPHAGRPAVLDPVIGCGRCPACRRGEPQTCPALRLVGVDCDGGLCSAMWAPEEKLHLVPEGVDMSAATLAEPLAVAVHAIKRASLAPGATVAVLGCGPVGVLVASCVRAIGHADLWVHDISQDRREAAADYGFEVLDEADPLGDVLGRAPGGVDAVFEAAGVTTALTTALAMVRAGGTIGAVGVHREPCLIDMPRVTLAELRVVGTRALTGADLDDALNMLARKPSEFSRYVTTVEPWERLDDAIERLAGGVGVKTVIACPSDD
jgi:(R,R)-butanediol dehydrogenase / meso-butanediol dehydrogenase / diacetyl reductase